MFNKRNLIFTCVLILGVSLISGCWLIPSPTYTVTFDSQGGSAVGSQTVERGGLVTEPTAPTKTSYTFAGWYKELECTNSWDFDTDTVASDVTLYAKWATNTYTVTFNKNGGDTEANPKTKTATHGGNVGTLPTAPTRAGYTFTSWDTKTNGSGTEFKATTAVTADITVYAQWTINTYTVTFNSQGGSAVTSQTVAYGGLVTEPTAPTKTGYTFGGWYKETGCTNAWGFATDTVTSDVTLYAKWTGSVHNITQKIYYTTIQAALDAAVSGDTIVADDGTYAESITFPNGMLITLKSLNDASSTFITGVDGSATVTCSNCLDTTALEGFTINHESGDTGRGITITNGYLTINNCNISDNSVTDGDGGAIYNDHSILTVTNSEISGNSSANYAGGIYHWYGTLTITGSTISGNSSAADGGGIYLEQDTITITGSTISGNTAATGNGGGIYNEGTITITDSEISGNTAATDAGGIYNHGTLTITGSEISGNSAPDGGGIYIYDSSPIIKDNTISGNTASTGNGGGIYIESGTPTIGGANVTNTANFNVICGNTPDQINPDSYPNNYIFTNCDVIGETGPAGGLIFYDKGYVSDGWRYLEAAPSLWNGGSGDPNQKWSNISTEMVTTDTAIGTGLANSNFIISQPGHTESAAKLCRDYNGGGKDDWFLPSLSELNLMYANLYNIDTPIGGFVISTYWSSSEGFAGRAWSQSFSDGGSDSNYKFNLLRVRAVRAF